MTRTAARRVEATDRPAASLGAAEMLRELQLHQQELEQQNQELRDVQQQLAQAHDRYRDLYERAPVGYLTLDAEGRITGCNLMARHLLVRGSASLTGRPLSAFIAEPDADRWHGFRRRAAASGSPQRIELDIGRRGGASFHAQLDCLAVAAPPEEVGMRVTLTDISPRRQVAASRVAARHAVAQQEAARRHVARELHDDLGQRLSAVKLALTGLAGPSQPGTQIDEVMRALDHAVGIVRRMAAELRPLMLDDLGILACIEWLTREFSRQHRLDVRLSLGSVEPELDERTSLNVYRVLERVLRHVVEQPGAGDLQVGLQEQATGLFLEVRWQVRPVGRAGAGADDRPDGLRARNEIVQGADLLGYQVEFMSPSAGAHGIVVRFPRDAADATLDGWPLHDA